MSSGRPPSFQFYPRDFMADTGHLTDRQRSRYLLALCRSWLCGGYGVGTPAEWWAWFGYTDPAEWEADREVLQALLWVAPCEPEAWVQKRMASERGEQAVRYRSAQKGARIANAQRTHSDRTAPAERTHSAAPASASASASAVESTEDSKSNTRRASGPEREPRGFQKFYEAYPRRDGRRAAAKAFASALTRHPDYTAENLFEGAVAFTKKCLDSGTEPRFIPLPATWINQDRFREFFDEDDHAASQVEIK